VSRRLTIGPFNRVEGDLEVTLDIADGRVESAQVCSSLYRGFEQILIAKHPLDALVIVPRICGICSLSQSAAAAAALADATGLPMPANGRLASKLILACENLADHLTHFYLFFMPDFARAAYRGRAWHALAERRFQADVGEALREVLPARADWLRLMGYLAGKWPHSLALQPGGTTRAITATEKVRLLTVLREFRAFLSSRVFGDTLENVGALHRPTSSPPGRRGGQATSRASSTSPPISAWSASDGRATPFSATAPTRNKGEQAARTTIASTSSPAASGATACWPSTKP
jgi:Ni,Fe-hydrogenase I large subunit